MSADIRDADAVTRAFCGADAVAHLVPDPAGTANVLRAMSDSGSPRIVFASCALVYGATDGPVTEDAPLSPTTHDGRVHAEVEKMLAEAAAHWVAIRLPLVVGRGVDNRLRAQVALPVLAVDDAGRRIQVVHTDDVLRLLNRAIVETEIPSGPINLAVTGTLSYRQAGRRVGPARGSGRTQVRGLAGPIGAAERRTHGHRAAARRLGFTPAWTAPECLEDFALAVRGRVTLGGHVVDLPWRLAPVQDLPAIDSPAEDGVVPRLAGPPGVNGEFDTPIDPRFPTFWPPTSPRRCPARSPRPRRR